MNETLSVIIHGLGNITAMLFIVAAAVILHEVAHGWTAYRLGDPTARLAGRLTLNPLAHIDPVGTIILPGILILLHFAGWQTFLFGWAKPVPVNFAGLRHPRRDMILTALAGPFVNMAMAVLFGQWIKGGIFAPEILIFALQLNLALAIFNLIPVPPLDGSRVVMGLLPRGRMRTFYMRLEPYGLLIVFGLLYIGLLDKIIHPVMRAAVQWLGVIQEW